MKLLHIASFNGNIGDIANHQGFYDCFHKYVVQDCQIDQIEIRDFYHSWGRRKFDQDFVKTANQYDLLVLGGGAFFQPKWDYSATGTTFDLSEEVLTGIKTPMLFNAVGFGVPKDSTESSLNKFGRFLKRVTTEPNYLVSVRNDGSHEQMMHYYGEDVCSQVYKSPDFGYFVNPSNHSHKEIVEGQTTIAIILGGDMPQIRFPNQAEYLTREEFIRTFSDICNVLLTKDSNRRIVFIPHHPQDIKFIGEVLENISDRLLRLQVTCAPYLNGTITDGLLNIGLYKYCDLVLGMRHHANVCSIAMNVPNLGIVNLEPHEKDFEEIGLKHRCFKVNKPGFEKALLESIEKALNDPQKFKNENEVVLANMEVLCENYLSRVVSWLKDLSKC